MIDTETGEVTGATRKPGAAALAIHGQQKGRSWTFGAAGLTYTLSFEVNPGHADAIPGYLRGGASVWWQPKNMDEPTLIATGATSGGYTIRSDADDFEHHVLKLKVPQDDLVEGVAVMDGPARSANDAPAGTLYIEQNQQSMGF
jgi:hypothetical protein